MIVVLGNIYSKIIRCTPDEFKLYREVLTFFAPNYWFNPRFKAGNWDGQIKLFQTKEFPTGLLPSVQSVIPNLIVKERKSRIDLTKIESNILNTKKMSGKYAYQLDVVRTAVDKRRGIISVATGGGKTVIAAGIIKYLNLPTLFLVPTKDLLLQTHAVFTKEIGGVIGIWGSGKEDLQKITVAMPKTVVNRLSKKKYKEFVKSRECIFCDECHLSSAKTWQKVLKASTGAGYRYGLSGTPFCKTDLDNANVMAYLGGEIYKISNDDLIQLKANSTPVVTFFKLMHLTKEVKYPEIYTACIVESKRRNNQAVDTALNLLKDSKEVVLMLVQKIEHGNILAQLLKDKDLDVTFCYGDSDIELREKALDDLRSGKIKVLILSRIGELGVDIPNLSSLIYAGGGKSTVGTLQRIGRLLRNPTNKRNLVKFYDFYDYSIPFLEQHSQKRLEDYTEEGFEIQYVDVT